MVRICFVCLGNICRSPTAEGIMIALVEDAKLSDAIANDSAGTAAFHVGEKADARSRQIATQRGVDLASRARMFRAEDFEDFDYVIAMDKSNQRNLLAIAPSDDAKAKITMLRDYDPKSPNGADVPDPYYGGPNGFDDVFDICDAGCRGLLQHIQKNDLS